jgi:hypothetical protein
MLVGKVKLTMRELYDCPRVVDVLVIVLYDI